MSDALGANNSNSVEAKRCAPNAACCDTFYDRTCQGIVTGDPAVGGLNFFLEWIMNGGLNISRRTQAAPTLFSRAYQVKSSARAGRDKS